MKRFEDKKTMIEQYATIPFNSYQTFAGYLVPEIGSDIELLTNMNRHAIWDLEKHITSEEKKQIANAKLNLKGLEAWLPNRCIIDSYLR